VIWVRLQHMCNAFVEGHASAGGENQQRDNEAPEVEFSAMAQRVALVGRARGATNTMEQQALIGSIDQ
jgi:hypothetical protein